MRDCTELGQVRDFEVTPTSTSLAVSWTAPSGQQPTAYQVKLKGVANTQKFTPDTSTTFDNLLPGKHYTVIVTPIYGSTLGNPAERVYTTSKSMYMFRFILDARIHQHENAYQFIIITNVQP